MIASPSTTSKHDAAINDIATRLRAAVAPAIAGLDGLSLDAIDAAVRLAMKHEALLLPHPAVAPEPARQRVSQHGSLEAACDAELIVWVGCNGETSDVTRTIATRQLRAAFVQPDVATVLKLRAIYTADPKADPIGTFKRVAVVLAHDVEQRVVSQWHRLAADLQTTVRVSVLQLPDPAFAHRRAVEEVTTWLTGASPAARGGVMFVDGKASPCSPLDALLRTGAIDFVLWLGAAGTMPPALPSFAAITTGPTKGAAVAVELPALSETQRGAVMRFDGVATPLRGDNPDEMAAVLQQLLEI